MNGCILTCEHDGCNTAVSVKMAMWIPWAAGRTFKHFKEPQFANENFKFGLVQTLFNLYITEAELN